MEAILFCVAFSASSSHETVAALSSSSFSAVDQLNRTKLGNPNTLSTCAARNFFVAGSLGYPEPYSSGLKFRPSGNLHVWMARSRATLAQMLAALTMGKVESAFLATVILMSGNMSCSFAWYFSGGPTVSTYTSVTQTPSLRACLIRLMAESWLIAFRLYLLMLSI
uniref:Putative secreted protein n=1 Tax=Ixodes ricinus TaxID=34613 RepID=A0A147BFY0_IXORI